MPHIYKDESGRILEVRMDEKVTADSPLAVQGHDDPRVNGESQHPLGFLEEPSPNEVSEREAAEAAKAKKSE